MNQCPIQIAEDLGAPSFSLHKLFPFSLVTCTFLCQNCRNWRNTVALDCGLDNTFSSPVDYPVFFCFFFFVFISLPLSPSFPSVFLSLQRLLSRNTFIIFRNKIRNKNNQNTTPSLLFWRLRPSAWRSISLVQFTFCARLLVNLISRPRVQR